MGKCTNVLRHTDENTVRTSFYLILKATNHTAIFINCPAIITQSHTQIIIVNISNPIMYQFFYTHSACGYAALGTVKFLT